MQTNMNNKGRFKGADWFDQISSSSVIIGGAGGIGSWLGFLLARMGVRISIFDFDTIEGHNLGGQFFRGEDVGKLKVEALSEIAESFCGATVNTFPCRVDRNTMTHKYIFSAFDNMEARKDLFEVWKKSALLHKDSIYIDGRLEMEQLQIFCVTPENISRYEDHLFSDSDVESPPCTMKQTSYSAAMIASHMIGFFTNHMANVGEGSVYRDVPFYFEFVVPMTYTKIEQ